MASPLHDLDVPCIADAQSVHCIGTPGVSAFSQKALTWTGQISVRHARKSRRGPEGGREHGWGKAGHDRRGRRENADNCGTR